MTGHFLPTIFESVSCFKVYRGPLGLLPFFLKKVFVWRGERTSRSWFYDFLPKGGTDITTLFMESSFNKAPKGLLAHWALLPHFSIFFFFF